MKEKKKMTPRARNEALWGYAFVAPTMLGLIILNFYPAINTVYQSFCKTGDFGKGNTFVGLANYAKAFSDPEIWQSLINTIKYAIIEVPFGVVIAFQQHFSHEYRVDLRSQDRVDLYRRHRRVVDHRL